MSDIKQIDSIMLIKNFLSKEDCDYLINEYNIYEDKEKVREKCAHAFTGVDVESTFKRVSLKPETKAFNIAHNSTSSMIKKWIAKLREDNWMHSHALEQNTNYSHMYRLMCYEEGGWIHPHTDWSPFVVASCTFNLNNDYEGGEFSFFNDRYIYKLDVGDALIFPASPFWVHEVKTITKGKRYSVNSFISVLPWDSMNKICNQEFIKTLNPPPSSRFYCYR